MTGRKGSSPSDLSRFNGVFFEESSEHLETMERLLLAVDPSDPCQEDLHAIFRAAHSIKGGAGVFGFSDLAEVTHLMESLLDRLRNREIPLTPDLIDLVLEAGDVLGGLLAGHREGAPVDRAAVDEVYRRLEDSLGSAKGDVPPSVPIPPSDLPARRFSIDFHPPGDTLKRGIRIENLFNELAELGTLTVSADFPDLPDFHAFDPELCHARWHLTLEGPTTEEELRDIFEFVADEAELEIRVEGEDAGAIPAHPPAAQEGEAGTLFGRRAYDRDETAPGAFGRRGQEGAEASIRVGVAKVDQLVNQVGELVITQAMLTQIGEGLDPVQFEALHRALLQLERSTRELQESVMSIRLVPIGGVFSRFPRLVREVAAKLGKEVELRTFGEGTELDKGLIEKIADPLTHLVRNSLDHGIESPEARVAAGKNPMGTVTLRASQVGGRIVIEVADDGAGLSREKILRKAAALGVAAGEDLSDEEVWHLIFAPGFSTAEAVTDVSGRGVGMDVVLKNVQALGGRVQLASEQGRGARFTLSLPLTLAILDGLSVRVGGEKFIVPLNAILESFQPAADDLKTIRGGSLVVHVRGDYLPVISLHEIFGIAGAGERPEEGILVLVDAEGERAALFVDELLGQHQVVIKSLETNYRKVEGTAGATILGDGKVAFIIDVGAAIALWRRGRERERCSTAEECNP